MGRIQVLPPELVNQIAAGEVVERPSSVVKELVENAIDAGATRIEVQAKEGGRYLRVADNGYGMDREDLEKAFHNHATSKVKNIDDLFRLQTLGFRGEALASVAAIAKVTCWSRTAEADLGLKAAVHPSGDVSLQETGCATGTIFEVRDLFYNVPARLKFLKRPQTELSHIQETVQMLALSHPEIAFQLSIEDSQAVKTSGSGDLAKVVGEVFTLSTSDTLIPFEWQDEDFGYRVWGQTSTPNVTRGSRKWMMTFVNGRSVRCPILSKAIETSYNSLMTPGKFPITVLFLELPTEAVDVNVHPTKKEVKYQQANTMFSFVRRGLEGALVQSLQAKSQREMEIGSDFTDKAPTLESLPRPSSNRYPSSHTTTTSSGGVSSGFQLNRDTTARASAAYKNAALELYAPPTPVTHDLPEKPADPFLPQLPEFKVIGQLSKTYILVETREGLLVVDQHIASERVRFEYFSDQAQKSESVSQALLIPLTFPVSAVTASTLEEHQTAFEALGFQYTLSPHEICFTQVPSLYNDRVLKTSLEALLQTLEETGEVRLSVDDVMATAACHSAVRAGDDLNLEQMQRIITQWYACQRPWTCPHGRPVSHLISHQELMAYFERPSLPITRTELTASK